MSMRTHTRTWQTFGKLLHAHGLDHEAQLAYSYANQLQHTSETTYLHAVVCAETGDYEQAIAFTNNFFTFFDIKNRFVSKAFFAVFYYLIHWFI